MRADLDGFIARYRSGRRFEREESEKFKRFPLDALLARDKVNLDIFWLKDDALEDPDLLPPPDEAAAEMVDSLGAALQRDCSRSAGRTLTETAPYRREIRSSANLNSRKSEGIVCALASRHRHPTTDIEWASIRQGGGTLLARKPREVPK